MLQHVWGVVFPTTRDNYGPTVRIPHRLIDHWQTGKALQVEGQLELSVTSS